MSGKRPSILRYIRRFSARVGARGRAAELAAQRLADLDAVPIDRDERIGDHIGRLRPGRTNAREERRAGSAWAAHVDDKSNRRRPSRAGIARHNRDRAWRRYTHARDRGDRALTLAMPRRRALVLSRRAADSALLASPSVPVIAAIIADAIIKRRDVQRDIPLPANLALPATPASPRAPASV